MNKAEKKRCCAPHPAARSRHRNICRGRSPGTMQRYAPDAHADPEQGWVEDEDTVRRLAKWREEAIY